jgi:regulator of sirC expression with transglutaminase-like and TPR domain
MGFEDLSRLPEERIDVALGAAMIARDVYPGLDVDGTVAKVRELAAPLVGAGLELLRAPEQAARLAQHLYVDLGFKGNEDEYYDPRNSLLPDVLERRTGIPITLAIVYMAVARRVGVETSGVAFPGHFLVRIENNPRAGEAPGAILVDPFYGGKALREEDLVGLLKRTGESELKAEHVVPASARAILVRMLVNLKGIYFSRGDYPRAHLALDRIVTLTPDSVAALKGRALLAAKLGSIAAARADLTRVLELDPDATDVAATKATLARLERKTMELN